MKELQFGATLLLALLTMKLLMLPIHPASRLSLGRARWLMVASTGLLAVQFALQYALQLRTQGLVATALMINLAFFIPVSALLALAIIYLLRSTHVTALDRYISIPIWLVAMALLGYGVSTSGQGMLEDTWQLRWAEVGAGVLFAGMQVYYFVRHQQELRELRIALANYYDRDTDSMLNWMEVSIVLLAIIAMMIPPLLFTNGWWLLLFSIFIICGIFYLIDTFGFYVAGNASRQIVDMEQDEKMTEVTKEKEKAVANEEDRETLRSVERAVEKWIARGGYRKSGLIQPAAAEEIGVKQYLLRAWLNQQGVRYNEWLTNLRIDEAKRVLRAHPEWNNETIALHCGISDRTTFQKKFKEKTGMTPTEFVNRLTDERLTY